MSRNTRSALVALSLCCLALSAQAADKKPRIADEGSIGGEWKLAEGMKSLPVPGYPETMKERGDSVCVAIGYSIDPTGKTGDFTLLKSWSSGTRPAEGLLRPVLAPRPPVRCRSGRSRRARRSPSRSARSPWPR